MTLSGLLDKLMGFIVKVESVTPENNTLPDLLQERDAIVAEITAYMATDIDASILQFSHVKEQYDFLINQLMEKRQLTQLGLSNMNDIEKYHK